MTERLRTRLPNVPLSCNDSGQVVHTHMPLSPSSIMYWPQDCDAGKVAESNGSLLPGL